MEDEVVVVEEVSEAAGVEDSEVVVAEDLEVDVAAVVEEASEEEEEEVVVEDVDSEVEDDLTPLTWHDNIILMFTYSSLKTALYIESRPAGLIWTLLVLIELEWIFSFCFIFVPVLDD